MGLFIRRDFRLVRPGWYAPHRSLYLTFGAKSQFFRSGPQAHFLFVGFDNRVDELIPSGAQLEYK